MGLCLGFSLLSVVELIYFFTLRWCVLCCRRKGGGGGGIQNMVIRVVQFLRGRALSPRPHKKDSKGCMFIV